MIGTLEVIKARRTRSGQLRMTFLLEIGNSRLTLSGYRYDPERGALLPPSFVGRRGGRVPTVKAEGRLAEAMLQAARETYSEQTK